MQAELHAHLSSKIGVCRLRHNFIHPLWQRKFAQTGKNADAVGVFAPGVDTSAIDS
jgi:hypothetical protein